MSCAAGDSYIVQPNDTLIKIAQCLVTGKALVRADGASADASRPAGVGCWAGYEGCWAG